MGKSRPYLLVLHNTNLNLRYIMTDAIDYFQDEGGTTYIHLRSGNTIKVLETPKQICDELMKTSSVYTRSEQQRWLEGE